MKKYSTPAFELVVNLESYCESSIETENVSSQTAGNGGIHHVTLPNDPMGELA